MTIWTLSILDREKVLFILFNRSIIQNSFSCSIIITQVQELGLKRNFVLVNTRKLGKVSSIDEYYNSKTLEQVNGKNLILRLTQKNSIENSIQDCLPYILNYHGSCYYFPNLS